MKIFNRFSNENQTKTLTRNFKTKSKPQSKSNRKENKLRRNRIENKTNFIVTHDVLCYNHLDKLEFGEELSQKYRKEFGYYMWNEVKNEIDIENLMKEYSGFHDSCIVSINYHSGASVDDKGAMANGGLREHSIEMILHSQCNKPIELRFTGVRKCNIVGWEDNYFCDILGAYLNFHSDLLGKTRDDKLIVWADWDGFNPINYMEEKPISTNGKYSTYVIAEKLFWRTMTED